jgi:hypothetical protein
MKLKLICCLALILSGFWFCGCGTASAQGMPPPPPGPNLPGVSRGKIDAYWLAPYVRAAGGFGGTTVTWFDAEGHVKTQAAATTLQPGFVSLSGSKHEVQGVNEDWKIVLSAEPGPGGYGYTTSTPDSRVFLHEFHPQQGMIGLHIYVHGKPAPVVGPFLQYLGREVVLNDDGSTGLLIWKDETHTNAQVVVTDTNGVVRWRGDCDAVVDGPIVAPDGAGVLLHPNKGGEDQNTFWWYTAQGKQRSVKVSPNPWCVGWIPQSRQSLFWTSVGSDSRRFQLIDWDSGRRLWEIPGPGSGQFLGVALTPEYIIFAMAELHPSPPGSGMEWRRAFYAVKAQDGSLAARWTNDLWRRSFNGDRDHFLQLGGRLYYVTAEEVAELKLEDIRAKQHGWE